MSLFIIPENQKLLWNVINKNQLIVKFFSLYPPQVKEKWFKDIVRTVYDQNMNNRLSQNDLYELNKNVLAYMVGDIKNKTSGFDKQELKREEVKREEVKREEERVQLQTYSVTENKEDKFNKQYNQYQQSYQTMFEKKPPESPDFSEKNTDPVISNMDELIKKHIRERDEELKKYSPQPLFTQKIEIDNTETAVNLQVEDIEVKPKKTVKWIDDNQRHEIETLKTEVLELTKNLKNQVLELTKNVECFKEEIRSIKNKPSVETFSDMKLRFSQNFTHFLIRPAYVAGVND